MRQEKMSNLLDKDRIPKHVAIIMDGNRRWAKKLGFSAKAGHLKGAETLDKIVKYASEIGVEILTVYAFSTENWGRAPEEVDTLMKLFKLYLIRKTPSMVNHGVKLETIGDLTKFPEDFQQVMRASKEATKNSKKIQLVLALNYGSRNEITRAVSKIVDDVQRLELRKDMINEELIARYLDTSKWKDPELLIRTSGESRLSNFLLWQLSYSELHITEVCWPEFSSKDFYDAIIEYQQRDRRFGE